ncbi:MAG TPA: hypothetical protein VIO94_03240 [Phenylobacterium sp.]
MKPKIVALLAVLTTLALAACASQPYPQTDGAPGFFWGLVHGWISFFSLIGHVFEPEVRVYAFPNSGGWYDFGFLLGVGSLGAGGASAKR